VNNKRVEYPAPSATHIWIFRYVRCGRTREKISAAGAAPRSRATNIA